VGFGEEEVVQVVEVMEVMEVVSEGLTVLDKLVRICGFICPSVCAQLN
jgi:hypothetical protein